MPLPTLCPLVAVGQVPEVRHYKHLLGGSQRGLQEWERGETRYDGNKCLTYR